MYNKRVLSQIVVSLDSAKPPKQKRDIIVDPRGQWEHPGEVTRIPSNQITMQGVPYPVMGVSDTGDAQMMYPGQDYEFDGNYVDEYPQMAKGGSSEQKIIFAPKEGGCPDGQYWTGTECKPIPKNTRVVYSQEELDKLNISKKEQQRLYNEYINRTNKHSTINAALKKKYGPIQSKDKFYNTLESIPGHGFSPLMSYGPASLITNGLGPGIPSMNESMVDFKTWKKMMNKSAVKPIGYKGNPGGGHFYPVYEKPSNYILGYNREEEVNPDTDIQLTPNEPATKVQPEPIPFVQPKNEGLRILQQRDVPRTMKVPVQSTETYYVEVYPGGPKVPRQRPITIYEEVPWTDERAGEAIEYDINTGSYKNKKGGSTKSKKYSRSLEATNKLLHENPLFKKPKSKKKKIYDPYSKYFEEGGILPEAQAGRIQKNLGIRYSPFASGLFSNALRPGTYEDPAFLLGLQKSDVFPKWSREQDVRSTLLGELQIPYAMDRAPGIKGQWTTAYTPNEGENLTDFTVQGQLEGGYSPQLGFNASIMGWPYLSASNVSPARWRNEDRYYPGAFRAGIGPEVGVAYRSKKYTHDDGVLLDDPRSTILPTFNYGARGFVEYTPADWLKLKLDAQALFDPQGKKETEQWEQSTGVENTENLKWKFKPGVQLTATVPVSALSKKTKKAFDKPKPKSTSKDYMERFQDGGIPYDYNQYVSAEPEVLEQSQEFIPIRTENDPEDYDQFLNYSETAPENRRPNEGYTYGDPNLYDHYGMWETLGKPENFEQALQMNPDWKPDPYDDLYHGYSVNDRTGVFLKSGKPGLKPGDTNWMEVLAHYLSPRAQEDTPVYDPELQRFKYIPNEEDGGFSDDINKRRQVLEDWTYGKDIGMTYIPEAQTGLAISDPKEYKFRKAMYDDSLSLYNAYQYQRKNTPIYKGYPYKKDETMKTKVPFYNSPNVKPTFKNYAEFEKELDKYDAFIDAHPKDWYKRDKELQKIAPRIHADNITFTNKDDLKKYSDHMAKEYKNPNSNAYKIAKYYEGLKFNYPTKIGYYEGPDLSHSKIKAKQSYWDGLSWSPVYKKPVQQVYFGNTPVNDAVSTESQSTDQMNLPLKKLTPLETSVTSPNGVLPVDYGKVEPGRPTKFAYRSQTVMEADPNRPGKFKVKELKQVPYSYTLPNRPGDVWELMDTPRVIYLDEQGNESETRPEIKNPKLKRGGLPKAQDGIENKNYIELEADDAEIANMIEQGYIVQELPKAQEGLITYKNNRELVDSTANFDAISKVDVSPEYNDQIKHRLYTGNYGYNPNTGEIVKLSKAQREAVPESIKKIRAQEEDVKAYNKSVEEAGGIDPRMMNPKSDWSDTQREEFIRQGFDAAVNNPAFKTAAYVTPVGMAIGSLEGMASLVPDLYKGDYVAAALDAAELLPFAGKAIKNAYKINPWAFKPNPKAYYRGIGKAGLEDALQSGVFRQAGFDNKNYNNYKSVWYATGDRGLAKARDFSKDYIAEVPKTAFPETGDEFFGSLLFPTRGTQRHIPIEEGRILQKDWLRGYKEVPKELPGSPNSFTRSGLGSMDMSGMAGDFGDIYKDPKFAKYNEFLKEGLKHEFLPESTSLKGQELLSDFRKRIRTPKGMKRLNELGIKDPAKFDEYVLKEINNSLAYHKDSPFHTEYIGLHKDMPEDIVKKITRHELEHAVQKVLRRPGEFNPTTNEAFVKEGLTEIDDILDDLDFARTPSETFTVAELSKEPIPFPTNEELFSNPQKNLDYFVYGSGGKEKSAFLAEVQQSMLENKIIDDVYDDISPEKVKEAYNKYISDKSKDKYKLRMFDIIKPTEANFTKLSKGLNKMLGLTIPVVVGAAATNE